ncbi:MAG TPA: hypothetical protein VF171_05815 [Trueperaceae bacterium]
MKKTHSPERILDKLRRAEAVITLGKAVPEGRKEIHRCEQATCRGRNKNAGMGNPGAKRLNELDQRMGSGHNDPRTL